MNRKSKNKGYVSYSTILIEFIDPLLSGEEDEDEFLMKAKAGMIAWNFCVADMENLEIDASMKAILKAVTKENSEAKETLNALVLRKQTLFSQYDQFIFKTEIRRKPDGSASLYVESAPSSVL